jgi:hypothetical protein
MTAIEHEPAWTVAVASRATSSTVSVAAARRSGVWSRSAWREFLLLAAVYELYSLTRRLNHVVSTRPYLALPADYAYATLHYVVTLVVLVWLWRAHPIAYLSARRSLMAATLLGLVGFATVPLAPPRMLPGFIDTMARYGHYGWWDSAASAPRGLGSLTNEFAAMPSLHVGWAIWCGWMVARHAQRGSVRGLALAYPALVVLVVLSTANHYLLDAVAGLFVLLTGFAICRTAVRLGWLKPAPTH